MVQITGEKWVIDIMNYKKNEQTKKPYLSFWSTLMNALYVRDRNSLVMFWWEQFRTFKTLENLRRVRRLKEKWEKKKNDQSMGGLHFCVTWKNNQKRWHKHVFEKNSLVILPPFSFKARWVVQNLCCRKSDFEKRIMKLLKFFLI